MKKFIFVFFFALVSAIANNAHAVESTLPPIHVCPAYGCGPAPIHPIEPIVQLVPSGYYYAKTANGGMGLVVSGSAGATLYESFAADPSEEDIARFPELVMNILGQFSSRGTMAPSCDADRACPEFIELLNISGVYHAAAGGQPASIDLTIGGATYHLVEQVIKACPAWGCGPAPVQGPIEL